MQLARKISLCLVSVPIGVLLIGVAAIGSIPHTALAIEHEMYLSRYFAVRLASLTSLTLIHATQPIGPAYGRQPSTASSASICRSYLWATNDT